MECPCNVEGGWHRKYEIWKNGVVVCSARVVTKIYFMAFLPSNGLHIGPCMTISTERGKGYYPALLQYIIENNPDKEYFLIINDKNRSSIRGAVKAGFYPWARGHRTKTFRWIIDEYL